MTSADLDDEVDLQAGRRLGPYELVVALGEGGMARVWAARHRSTRNIVALKMLRSHLAEDRTFREMFLDEARIASRIDHENVCKTYELTELDGVLTLVLEWVDGASLIQVLRPDSERRDDAPRVALPLRHAVKIVAETCAGLHHAHNVVDDQGHLLMLVHRDVSPHNVLLTRDGRVKITDFGVAKALGKINKTLTGQVKGKLGYMPPEQLLGGTIDRRSDVYALGSVLYEATTGVKPFSANHDPDLMNAIVNGAFRPPSEVVPGYPRTLEKIVLRAMSMDPNTRFPSALQLRQVLEGWLATSGAPIRPEHISQLLHERCRDVLRARPPALGGRSAPPIPMPMPSAAAAPPSGPPIDRDNGRSRRPGARSANPTRSGLDTASIVLAVLVGLVIGLGALAWVRETRRAHARPFDVGTAGGDAASGAMTLPTDAGTATRERDGAAQLADGGRPEVRLVTPAGARIFADGEELPPGVMSIPRPKGRDVAVNVLVRVEGRQDTVVVVEASSPDEIEVTMAPKPKVTPGTTAASPKANSTDTVLPPNPYE